MKARIALLGVGTDLFAALALAQPYTMDWVLVSAGGGTGPGGLYEISASVGQPVLGHATVGPYSVRGGFWNDSSAPAGGVELIVNGGFENTAATFVADSYGLMSLPAGSTVIPGWTTTDAELAWSRNDNTFGGATPFGAFYLDLTGYHDQPPYAGVRQTVATTPGQTYRLTLSLGSNAEYPGAAGQKQVAVSCGNARTTFTFDPVGTSNNEWGTFHFHFTADTAGTEVIITGLTASGIYLGLDNISMVATHPPELKVTGVEQLGNELRFRLITVAGRTYVIDSLTDLGAGTWTPVSGSEMIGTGQATDLSIPTSLIESRRFYRVRMAQLENY